MPGTNYQDDYINNEMIMTMALVKSLTLLIL
jgi:hypothetical protein